MKEIILAGLNENTVHEGSHCEGSSSRVTADGTEIHTMPGVPTDMAIIAVVSIIIVSHFALIGKKTNAIKSKRWDLLSIPFIKTMVKKSYFPLFAQSLSIILFLLIMGAGLFGNQNLESNIAPVLTWTWWWVLLIFLIMGFGKAFCTICPWEGITSLITALSFKSRIKKMGWELKWPKWAKNVYPALILFIILTWAELGYDITRSPSMTALMGVIMLALAFVVALIFEKRSYCRYACLVGRISGLYALFSPVELRPIEKDTCLTCTSKACYHGTDTTAACPTSVFPGNLNENTYCTLCTECVRSCPHDNLAINKRPIADDLMTKSRFRKDEAVLAIVLLALTSFHGLTMTPQWWQLKDWMMTELSLSENMSFTVLMFVMIVVPILMFLLAAQVARFLTRSSSVSKGELFKAFAYPIIPVALFYHLAHNGMHFFVEAESIIPLLSDPFGWGWDLFGTRNYQPSALLGQNAIWCLQVVLIVIGHIYGVKVADRIAKKLFSDSKQAFLALTPLIITMIVYSIFSVWLIAQDMEMRTGM